MHAQLAARHSAEESQEAFKDILAWSKKQKIKDRALAKAAASRLLSGVIDIDDPPRRSLASFNSCVKPCKGAVHPAPLSRAPTL